MRIMIVIGLACVLTGCASSRNAPTSCDGTARRVMNKGQWDEQMSLGACQVSDVKLDAKWGHA